MFDGDITTSSSSLATHPKTVTVSGTDMPALQTIERDDTIFADPALVMHLMLILLLDLP